MFRINLLVKMFQYKFSGGYSLDHEQPFFVAEAHEPLILSFQGRQEETLCLETPRAVVLLRMPMKGSRQLKE